MARILVVDDELGYRDTISRFLANEGYEIKTADSVDSALTVLDEHPIDVVVSDIIMPRATGVDLMQLLKQSHPDIKVILITGEPTLETATEAVRAGAFDYISKPVKRQQLIKILATAVEIKRLEDQNRQYHYQLEALVEERTRALEIYRDRLKHIAENTQQFIFFRDVNQLAPKALELFSRNMGVEGGCFYLIEDGALKLIHSLDGRHQHETIPMPVPETSPIGQAMKTRKPLVINSIDDHSDLTPSGWTGYKNGSLLVLPCEGEGNELAAVITLHNKKLPPFGAQDVELARIMVNHTIESLRNMRLYKQVESSEQKYKQLVEQQRDVVLRVDLRGVVTYCSPSIESLTGFTVEESLGQNAFSFDRITPIAKGIDPYLEFARAIVNKENGRMEANHRKKDGGTVAVEIVANPQIIADEVVGIQCIMRDISERKAIENQLRGSEEKFRALSESSEDGIMRFDLDMRHLYANPAVEAMTGLSPEEFSGKTHRELGFPEDLCEVWEEALQAVFDTKSTQHTSFQLPNGIWIDWLLVPELDSDGQTVNSVITSARDISRIMEAEERLKQLASAIENAAEVVVITDIDGNITYVNPAFTSVTGYTMAEALGRTPRILKSGEHPAAFYDQLWATISAGEVWRGQIKNKTKDGTILIEDAVISPIRDESGAITGYSAIKRDITEQLELENKFLQAQKMEALGVLAGGIAHDFNNILGAIIGNAELAQMEVDKEAQTFEDLNTIVRAAERATDLVAQILAFSRKTKRDRSPITLSTISKEVTKLLKATLPNSITLKHTIVDKDLMVLADPVEIHQVIMNLCTNAVHAMDGTAGELRTVVRAISAENLLRDYGIESDMGTTYVELSVADTGVGIPQQIIDQVFDPFFTTKEKGKGTGLGLAAVHGIVTSLGGSIKIESEIGQGTIVSLALPTIESDVVGTIEENESLPTGFGTILLVDDESAIRRFVMGVLVRLGYNVLAAKNGQEALELFRRQQTPIHCVFTDLMMPVMSGLDMIEKIRSLDAKIPIVLGSGLISDETRERADTLGVHTILEKPYKIKLLAESVFELIGNR